MCNSYIMSNTDRAVSITGVFTDLTSSQDHPSVIAYTLYFKDKLRHVYMTIIADV